MANDLKSRLAAALHTPTDLGSNATRGCPVGFG
jgi:hypothetical protein